MRLERLMLDVDRVEANGDQEVRAARKRLIGEVQALLDEADRAVKRAAKLVKLQDMLATKAKVEGSQKAVEAEATTTATATTTTTTTRDDMDEILEEVEESEEFPAPKLAPVAVEEVEMKPAAASSPSTPEPKAMKTESPARPEEVRASPAASEVESEGEEEEEQEQEELREPASDVREQQHRAVVVVQDRNARLASVNLKHDGTLVVSVPGRKPVTYHVDPRRFVLSHATKEVHGDQLFVVLPRAAAPAPRQAQAPWPTASFGRPVAVQQPAPLRGLFPRHGFFCSGVELSAYQTSLEHTLIIRLHLVVLTTITTLERVLLAQ